jgi:hypothetical protein
VRSDKLALQLQSWHELFEANPELAATSRGISSLDGRNRADMLRADDPNDRH